MSVPLEYLTVRALAAEDTAMIAALLRAQSPEYIRFFYAFSFEEAAIAAMLSKRERDVYSGIFWHGKLIGIFMLRGWDEGYEVPAFGILIDERHRGGTLLKLTLEMSKLICRLSGASRMMAKIHPDNVSAKGARRLGLVQTGADAESGNLIYHLEV